MSRDGQPRILVLTSTYPRWAEDTDPGFVHELSRRLVDRGFDVDVLTPRGQGTKDQETIDGVSVSRYPYFFRSMEVLAYGGGILPKLKANPLLLGLVPFFMLGLYRAIRRSLKAKDYAAIHAHWIIPQGCCAQFARSSNRPPLLVTSHGGDLFGLRAGLLGRVKRWTLGNADAIAVVSGYMRDVVVKDFSLAEDRIRVLPMGVDLESRFSGKNPMPRDDSRLLFVGRLVEKKGVSYLLQALQQLRRERPDLCLDIIGDGPLRNELQAMTRSLELNDAVTFHGALPQSDLPEFYQRATVSVVPSVVDAKGDQEGLGLVTIEAMGCGCPVVASNLPAIRDVVEHEETGLLAEPGNAGDLARQLETLLANPDQAKSLAQRGQAFVLSRFDWERSADDYADTLRTII